MIIKEIDGEEREFELCPTGDSFTHVLFNSGIFDRKDSDRSIGATVFLRLVRKQHTFGPWDGPKAVFEETGEVKLVQGGQFYLKDGCLRHRPTWQGEGTVPYTILRPVSLE